MHFYYQDLFFPVLLNLHIFKGLKHFKQSSALRYRSNDSQCVFLSTQKCSDVPLFSYNNQIISLGL